MVHKGKQAFTTFKLGIYKFRPPGIESTVKYEWSLGTVILNCLGASPWNQNQTTPQTIGQSSSAKYEIINQTERQHMQKQEK